ncbi:MAG: hypothetical protein AAF585_15235 [Verrucomicrobiota bacterium]
MDSVDVLIDGTRREKVSLCITDEGLQQLRGLPDLDELAIRDSKITDAGL